MPSVDNRLVKMEFDNKQFLANILASSKSLDQFSAQLNNLDKSANSFNEIEQASKGLKFDSIASAVESLQKRFSTLGIVGMTVIQNLTNTVVNGAKSMFSALSGAVVQGGIARAQNIENAKFLLQGLISDGNEVAAILQDASDSVTDTAYGYDVAAKAAAQFAASGMRSGEKMQSTLRGLAGVAATTNSEYEHVSRIFTTVAGNGRLMGDQLLQFSSLGLNAAATIADFLGTTEQEVRDMVTEGEISFEIFAAAMDSAFGQHAKDANKTFNGVMSNIRASLARMGALFVSPLIEQEGPLVQLLNSLLKHFKTFEGALKPIATSVTDWLNGMFTNLNTKMASINIDAIASGMAKAFENLTQVLGAVRDGFRDIFPEATISQIQKVIDNLGFFIYNLKLTDAQLDQVRSVARGFASALDIVIQVAGAVARILGKVAEIVFPHILEAAAWFGDLVTVLDQTIRQSGFLETAIQGLEAVFEFLDNAIGGVIRAIGGFLEGFSGTSDAAGDASDGVDQASRSFEGLRNASETVGKALEKVHQFFSFLGSIAKKVGDLVGAGLKKIGDGISSIFQGNFNFQGIIDALNAALFGGLLLSITKFVTTVKESVKTLEGLVDSLGGVFQALADRIRGGGSGGIDPKQVLTFAAAIAVLAAALLILSGIDTIALTTSIVAVAAMMGEIVGFLKLLDVALSGVKPTTIMKIAVAIVPIATAMLILAAAVKKLGSMDLIDLAEGVGALGLVLGEFVVASKLLNGKTDGIVKFSAALIIMGTAMNIMAAAVSSLGSQDIKGLIKGLGSMAVILGEVAIFSRTLKDPQGIVKTATAMILIGTAMNILSGAVSSLGTSSVKELVKGLGSIAVLLGEIAAFQAVMSKVSNGVFKVATSMVILGAALNIMASAVSTFGSMNVNELIKGLGSIFVLLAEIVAFQAVMQIVSKDIGKISVSMIAVGAAVNLMAAAVGSLGGMSWESLAKGLIALGGALAILAVGMIAMANSTRGAAAMTIAAAALNMLVPPMLMLGSMSLTEIGKALLVVAGAFVAVGVAGKALSGAIPGLLALAAVLTALGLTIGALAVGMTALSVAMALLASNAKGLVDAVIGLFSGLIGLIPQVLGAIGNGIVQFAAAITAGAPVIFEAVTTILTGLLQVVIDVAPKLFEAIRTIISGALQTIIELAPQFGAAVTAIIQMLLQVITENIPAIAEAGLQLIIGFLTSIRDHIGEITTIAIEIITNFINTVAANLGSIIQSAFNLIISFINGLADAIRNNNGLIFDAIGNLVTAIGEAVLNMGSRLLEIGGNVLQGIIDGIGQGVQGAIDQVTGFFGGIVDGIKDFLGIHSPSTVFSDMGGDCAEGYKQGMENGTPAAEAAGTNLANSAVNGINSVEGIAQTAGSNLSTYANQGVASNVGSAQASGTQFAQSFATSVRAQAGNAQQAGQNVGQSAYQGINSNLRSMSPMGQQFGNQFSSGLKGTSGASSQAGRTVAQQAINGLQSVHSNCLTIGKNFGNDFVSGIKQTANAAYQAGASVAKEAKRGFESEEVYWTGYHWATGFGNGINDNTSYIADKARAAARAAKNAANNELGVSSPSKVMYQSGRWFVVGFGNGIANYTHYAETKAEDSARTALEAFNESINSVGSVFDGLDVNPTIRPNIDLTNVLAGTNEINSIFERMNNSIVGKAGLSAEAISGSVNRKAASKFEAELGQNGGTGDIYNTFNQYNTSPKALDRLTIYRQTKNLFGLKTSKGKAVTNA